MTAEIENFFETSRQFFAKPMRNPLPETTIINRAEMALYEKIETPEGIFIKEGRCR